MERGVEIFVTINFLVIGASHLLQPHEWIGFFKTLRNFGRAGAMANGFLSLSFGSIIVAFHWVWEGTIPIIITCIGIAQVIKSIIAFLVPELSLRTMSRPMAENPNGYRIGGAIFLCFAIILMLHLWKS
jgi:hypothetical protein